MKINWSVLISLILIAGVTFWAADSRRHTVADTSTRATTEAAVFTTDADASADNTGVMFIVAVGLILSALFFVSNATTQPEAKIAAKRLVHNRER